MESVNEIIHSLGYVGIVLMLTLCGAGLPIPEELPVLVGAFFSHQAGGSIMHWYLALPACLIGALCGDSVSYAAGYHWGRAVLNKHRWFAHFLNPENERLIEGVLQRHGMKVLLVARFLVGIRAPIYVVAGILRLPYLRFLTYDAIAAVPVVGGTFLLGYLFAANVEEVLSDFHTAKYVVMALVVVVGLVVAISWYAKRRLLTSAATGEREDDNHSADEGAHRRGHR